jgi:TM2 domain-containing membrane protein YozV
MASKEQIGRKCPYCGAMFTYDEYFCRACHRKFTDQNALDAPSSHKPEIYVVGLPKIGITLVLSFIGVGLGQFYNGDTTKGILFFLSFLLISFGYIATPYNSQIFLGIWIVAIIEALYTSRKISRCERSYAGISYPFYAELGLLALVAGLHILTGEPNMVYLAKLFPAVALGMG